MGTRSGGGGKRRAPRGGARGGPGRRDIAAEWAEGYRYFVEAIARRFAFLVDEHNFSPPTLEVVPPEAHVELSRGGSRVDIATEYGGEPWVVLRLEGHEPVALGDAVEELDPAHARRAPAPPADRSTLTPGEMDAFLGYQADFLRRHLPTLLAAGPELFRRIAARQNARLAGRGPR